MLEKYKMSFKKNYLIFKFFLVHVHKNLFISYDMPLYTK